MATTKITDLTAYTDPVNTDVLPIVDVTSDVTKKVSIANVMKSASLGTNALPGISFDGDPNTGVYSPGADQVAITTGGTERARIDSSGRLLVGTSSARSNFFNTSTVTAGIQAEATGEGSIVAAIRNANDATTVPVYLLAKSRGTTVGSNTVVQSGDHLGYLSFQGSDGSEFVEAARISGEVDGTPGANTMPGRLVFSVTADGASSPTERMRIGQNGGVNCFVGASNSTVRTSSTSGSDGAFVVFNNASNVGNGTAVAVIRADGDLENTNNSYGALSDAKLKENVVDASSQWNDLKALQVRKYNFKQETGYDTHTQIGLVAQEVELVSPGLVTESPDRDEDGNDLGTVTKSVNYSVLYMKAVKALQEAMERIETLEAKVAALESA